MTDTPSLVVTQSLGDKRWPLPTFSFAPAGRSSNSSRLISLVERARHTKSRNPNIKRVWTTLDPIKPVAPVIKTRSSVSITKFSDFTSLSISGLLSDIWLSDRIDFDDRKQFANMVTELYRNAHETIMRIYQRKWQDKRVCRN